MIKRIGEIAYKPLRRLSPSQFNAMKNCGYKSLLAEAFNKVPLLLSSAQSYYGRILHNMIELIFKGTINTESEFDVCFQAAIQAKETELKTMGFNFLVPLQTSVRGFGLQKGLVKRLILTERKQAPPSSNNIFPEKWVESTDKTIGGRIDLVIDTPKNVEIIDFKTGSITEESLDDFGDSFLDIKQEYKDQIKLYAYLFYEMTGTKPNNLSIVDLAKQKYPISFTIEECKSIYEQAKLMFRLANENIVTKTFNANPSSENCNYCLYRPACKYYLEFTKANKSTKDITGEIENVTKYLNGSVSISIKTAFGNASITKLSSEYFDMLISKRNSAISAFNLYNNSNGLIFSATKYTAIYEG